MTSPAEFLRLVVDPVRLAVLGRAAEGTVDIDETAASLGVPVRRVHQAAARLRTAGLLDEDLSLSREALRAVATELPRAAPPDPGIFDAGTWSDEEAEILGRFFSANRLVSIPSARAKRLIVLERLAQEFEPGLRYEEAEVNLTLQLWNADYASLRRYLVDEGFLTRAEGVYWRTGGRYLSTDPSEAPADGE